MHSLQKEVLILLAFSAVTEVQRTGCLVSDWLLAIFRSATKCTIIKMKDGIHIQYYALLYISSHVYVSNSMPRISDQICKNLTQLHKPKFAVYRIVKNYGGKSV